MSELMHGLADTLPVWRDVAVAALATFVIAALEFYAALMAES